MNNQKGFTLIELIVVIVILGILSAVAVPKFMNMQDEAHNAKTKAARGAFKAALSMAHGKSLASGLGSGANPANIDVDGTNLNMTNAWPTKPTDDAGCVALFNTLVDDDIKAYTTGTTPTGAEYLSATWAATSCTYEEEESTKTYNFVYTLGSGMVSQVVE